MDQSESMQVRQADLSGSPKTRQILSIEVFRDKPNLTNMTNKNPYFRGF